MKREIKLYFTTKPNEQMRYLVPPFFFPRFDWRVQKILFSNLLNSNNTSNCSRDILDYLEIRHYGLKCPVLLYLVLLLWERAKKYRYTYEPTDRKTDATQKDD